MSCNACLLVTLNELLCAGYLIVMAIVRSWRFYDLQTNLLCNVYFMRVCGSCLLLSSSMLTTWCFLSSELFFLVIFWYIFALSRWQCSVQKCIILYPCLRCYADWVNMFVARCALLRLCQLLCMYWPWSRILTAQCAVGARDQGRFRGSDKYVNQRRRPLTPWFIHIPCVFRPVSIF